MLTCRFLWSHLHHRPQPWTQIELGTYPLNHTCYSWICHLRSQGSFRSRCHMSIHLTGRNLWSMTTCSETPRWKWMGNLLRMSNTVYHHPHCHYPDKLHMSYHIVCTFCPQLHLKCIHNAQLPWNRPILRGKKKDK
jgi:hypothetical protein